MMKRLIVFALAALAFAGSISAQVAYTPIGGCSPAATDSPCVTDIDTPPVGETCLAVYAATVIGQDGWEYTLVQMPRENGSVHRLGWQVTKRKACGEIEETIWIPQVVANEMLAH